MSILAYYFQIFPHPARTFSTLLAYQICFSLHRIFSKTLLSQTCLFGPLHSRNFPKMSTLLYLEPEGT